VYRNEPIGERQVSLMDTKIGKPTIHAGMISYAHTAHAVSYSTALGRIEGADLVAIYDEDPVRGQRFADQFGVPFYKNLDEFLRREDMQAAIVCSPTNQHQELVCAAAHAGKHVLCEKPIATSLADARKMIETCHSAGVLLQIPFVCRFYPMLQTARKLVQSGEIGRVLGVIGGNRGVPPLPSTYPPWIVDPIQAGGGALLDHSVHVTDAMRFVFGTEVESVFAEKSILHARGLAVEDCGLLALTFLNGIIATVDPSWSIPENNPYHYDFYLRILGENGIIDLDDTRQALTVISDRAEQPGVSAQSFGVDVDEEMLRHFIRCVRVGENLFPAAIGEDGLRALEIALAAYDSIREHQPVRLNLAGGAQ
jgi:predicted dehydrogenase